MLNSAIYPSQVGEEAGGENDITIDFSELRADSDDEISLREKEELLAKKKLMLEKVLDRLQELILLSQQEPGSDALPANSNSAAGNNEYSSWGGGDGGSYNDDGDSNALDDMRAEASEMRIFSPDHGDYGDDDADDIADRESVWWQRIFSNKH